jgi:hypothetical protein
MLGFCMHRLFGRIARATTTNVIEVNAVNVWLHIRPLPARVSAGLEVHRSLCVIDAGNRLYFYGYGLTPRRRHI